MPGAPSSRAFGPPPARRKPTWAFENDLLQEPSRRKSPAFRQPDDRALAASMGGGQTLQIGPSTWVYSTPWVRSAPADAGQCGGAIWTRLPTRRHQQKLKVFYIACGKTDGLFAAPQSFSEVSLSTRSATPSRPPTKDTPGATGETTGEFTRNFSGSGARQTPFRIARSGGSLFRYSPSPLTVNRCRALVTDVGERGVYREIDFAIQCGQPLRASECEILDVVSRCVFPGSGIQSWGTRDGDIAASA